MSDQLEPDSMMREITDLEGRLGELRQAAGMPAPDLGATLDAALVELELAVSTLREMGADQANAATRSESAENERRVLRTVFTEAPVPLFLIDRDASVRRVNRQGATLLGTSPGYVSGKQFTAFCDLGTRAALRSQLAGVIRTGRRHRVPVRFLGREQPVDAVVTLARVWIRGEPDPMVVAVAGPTSTSTSQNGEREKGAGAQTADARSTHTQSTHTRTTRAQAARSPEPGTPVEQPAQAPRTPAARSDEEHAVATIVHRMDVLANAAELLLDDPIFNETVAVRRCARLLAGELADWAIVDLTTANGSANGSVSTSAGEAVPWQPGRGSGRGTPSGPGDPGDARDPDGVAGALQRQVVIGPDDERSVEVTQTVQKLDPGPGTLPGTVFTTRQSALRPHIEDLDLLGSGPDGQPICGALGVTTMLCVPIEDGDRCLGTITLAGSGEHGPFTLMDLSVVQRMGRYLGLVIRAARLFRRRAEVADALQSSLLPRRLPSIPGIELAAHYSAATHGTEVGGDFYDVFPSKDGWGMVLGDVCGKGEDAAAVTATARHAVRLVSRWYDDPTEVLNAVNEALLHEDRFVTAIMAGLEPGPDRATITLGTAGHPPAIVVRADGVIRATSRGGLPLGLFDDFQAGIATLHLGVGDTLFLHSDGVLEACNMAREEFGQERLLEVLAGAADVPVQEMLDRVQRALVDFCEGDLRDDVSMLAVRVMPRELP